MKISVEHVTKTFKHKTAVQDVSLHIKEGVCVGLLGPNGAGKSTLLNIITDVLPADKGEVHLDGKRLSSMKRKIGYLPQELPLYSWMTAKETLVFMGRLSDMPKKNLLKEIEAVLTRVGLKQEENIKVGTFSGGMKQRLGIAQALLHKPSFLILDEPVSALDPIGRREVLDLIRDIKKDTTVLVSTHILSDAEEICERLVIMKNGIKLEDTTLAELTCRNEDSAVYVELTPRDLGWAGLVRCLPYVQKVDLIGNTVKVTLDDAQAYKNHLIGHALKNNVDILRFETRRSDTLEEIFLRMVAGA